MTYTLEHHASMALAGSLAEAMERPFTKTFFLARIPSRIMLLGRHNFFHHRRPWDSLSAAPYIYGVRLRNRYSG